MITLRLPLRRLTVALVRQWPETGNWVVVLTATHPAFPKPTTTAVRVNRSTVEAESAKYSNTHLLTNTEVESMLR